MDANDALWKSIIIKQNHGDLLFIQVTATYPTAIRSPSAFILVVHTVISS